MIQTFSLFVKNSLWRLKLMYVLLFLMATTSLQAAHFLSQERVKQLIPQPLSVEMQSGYDFVITPKTPIYYAGAVQNQAYYLQNMLAGSTGFDLPLIEGKTKRGICISLNKDKVTAPEGYKLTITHKLVSIEAHDAAGAFYGIQTFLQLLPSEVYSAFRHKDITWCAAPVVITDAPNQPWRGVMFDVARYFYDKDFIKKYIDMMAMYKLNKFQFHFIDDSGWRLEIKKYPRLTEVGAWAGTDTHRLGGYYTQDDIKEIVSYAAVRGIEIIPEIEFPAHMLSAIVAYPWLSCTGLQHELPTQHFISRDILCVGKETSIQFLRDVLEETVQLFPSKYINIGGDEARYNRWEACPKCRAVMQREGFTKASELQGYLTNVVAEMMKEKGKTVMGWQEIIMRGKINTPVVSVVWLNPQDTITAKQLGHKAVYTPCTHLYYDFPESKTPGEVKAATWMPPVSLEKTYATPIQDHSESSVTLGVQACYWSDQFIHGTVLQEIPYLNENRSENYAEYLLFPRMLALSEVGWSLAAKRNFVDFRNRLKYHFERLTYKGCTYRVPEPIVTKVQEENYHAYTYHLESPVAGAKIVYTTDGSYPTIHSTCYTKPVTVTDKNNFRAMTVVSPRHYSLPLYTAPDYTAYQKYGQYLTSWKPLQIQQVPTAWRFECTGKITGNGTYEVTFIQTHGTHALHLDKLNVIKRNEQLMEVAQNTQTALQLPATYQFTIDDFEAGTPFYLEVMVYGEPENDASGLVFIQKK